MKRSRLRVDPPVSIDRRQFLVAGAALAASGCFASFGATDALYQWNKGISDSKWLRWLLFLGLIILPVYGLFILGDVLIFNTIEFFGGNKVFGGSANLGNGRTLASSITEDPNVVRHEVYLDGKLERVVFVRRVGDNETQLLDQDKKLLYRARQNGDSEIELLDADGKVLKRVSREQALHITASIENGRSVCAAVHAEVGMPGVGGEFAAKVDTLATL